MIYYGTYELKSADEKSFLKTLQHLFTQSERYDRQNLMELEGYLKDSNTVKLNDKGDRLDFMIAGRSFFIEINISTTTASTPTFRTFEIVTQSHKLLPTGKIIIKQIEELDISQGSHNEWQVKNHIEKQSFLYEYAQALIKYLETE